MGILKRFITIFKLRLKYKEKHVRLSISSKISQDSVFEGYNKIGAFVHFSGRIGLGSYINSHSNLSQVSIGRFSSIAQRVIIIAGSHAIKRPFVSTSPSFFSTAAQNGLTLVKEKKFEEIRYADKGINTVIIGNDCWLGWGCQIIGGVTIGDGAVVLANATVTKDVPPYAVVGGVPAKILEYRYDEETISKLLRLKWWDKDIHWIKEHAEEFSDLDSFLKNNI